MRRAKLFITESDFVRLNSLIESVKRFFRRDQENLSSLEEELNRAEVKTARFEVDINTAGWPELLQLPEIGETLAKRIVDSRRTSGPFRDHRDLMRVRGIGPKTFNTIKPYLRPMPDQGTMAQK